MKFGIITHAVHKIKDGQIYAYEPYVREMNLWAKHVDQILVLAPVSTDKISSIEIAYQHNNIKVIEIPNFDITTVKNLLRSLLVMPIICWQIYKVMKQSDHIHLRCPGNIGLLGCIVQILFPSKPKTAKYAGNWDPSSHQPITYKLQKWLLSNTFFTKNIKVLVYGEWPNQTKNIVPFFTASYAKNEIEQVPEKKLNSIVKFIFVGTFSEGKQPLLSVKTIEKLLSHNYDVQLDMYGEGSEFNSVKKYINDKELSNRINLHGNKSKEIVKNAFQKAHFLIFISKSEGWPKVVAEAMFWRCLPISTDISCVNYMLDFGNRGEILNPNSSVEEISEIILNYIHKEKSYQEKVLSAQQWSQNFTLNKLESEIKKIFKNE
ncbi:glycosyltransferase [Polaribacter septentrionalilitoris]|uniref:glycosyltransferase n=1 Tax=Polaribacter septentrionalilitoris TaxID=2494657 RepID=UPI00135CC4F2|nr:glycosyltransferase [Polaribacter septentrionalilitoris]